MTEAPTEPGKPRGRRPVRQGRLPVGDNASAARMSRAESKAAVRAAKSILAALDDPDLFGGMFDAPSWEPWKAFLAALQALPMSPGQLALYRKHTGRNNSPTQA